jgi:zinc/manganese transport system permease protein
MSGALADLLALLWAPFLMCLVLTGIHAYLGIHVIAREVVFVDIAMAQIAALGATLGFLAGFEIHSAASYGFGVGATVLGALVLALTRSRERRVSQEAVIGVVYAVSAGAAVLLLDRAPHGAEHLRAMLVGSILTTAPSDVLRVGLLYTVIGLLHWFCRAPFLLISVDPARAWAQGLRVRLWDFVFYASFGLVVTSSVRIAGVLLVFSYLIVPALAAMALGGPLGRRLAFGWAFGAAVSVAGVAGSAAFDLPTGATVVCAFGAALVAWWVFALAMHRGMPSSEGLMAGRPPGPAPGGKQ